ncbi:MAG: aldehyde dehydrogenase [Polyangiaceae bacterium]
METPSPAEIARQARIASKEWQRAGIARRLAVLQEVGEEVARRREEIVSHLRRESLSRRLADYFVEWIVHAADPGLLAAYARDLARWVRTPGGGELLVRRADGVVLIVTPGNSPTLQSASAFSVLLAGNAVIVRAPENDGGTRFLLEEIVRPALVRSGLSPHVAAVVTGKSRPILSSLVPCPDVDTVVFFGNSQAGDAVAGLGLQHRKKVVLELSGSDNLVVWRDAPVEQAVASASRAWFGSTQPCPVPKHIFVHGAVFDRFVEAFVADVPRHDKTVPADGEEGVLVALANPEGYRAALAEIREVGEIRCGGYTMSEDGRPDPEGIYAAPTVVTLTAEACRGRRLACFEEEISFPLIPVVRFDGDDDTVHGEITEMVEKSPFGLRASIWTASAEVMARFVEDVRSVGLILCNDDHARSPLYASPWGGPKRSGGPRGESHLFWEQTSHLQAIACDRLSAEEIRAIVTRLGCVGVGEEGAEIR